MGLLSALGGAIAPALNTATQAAGSYEGAEANAAMQQRQMMLQALVFARQQHQIDIENAMNQAKTNLTTRQANVPMPGDPGYLALKKGESAATAEGAAPTQEQLQQERIAGEGANAAKVAGIRNQGTIGAANINAGSRIGAANIANTGANQRNSATIGGQLNSRLQGVAQQQRGSILGTIGRDLHILPQLPPANGVPGAAPSQQQSDWDAAAAHASSLGKTPEQAGLPPRPVN